MSVVSMETIRYNSYCTLYQNLWHRLCRTQISVGRDFFTSYLENVDNYYSKEGLTGIRVASGNNVYLLLSTREQIALLLPPAVAKEKNLPYLSIWSRGFFRPQIGCVHQQLEVLEQSINVM